MTRAEVLEQLAARVPAGRPLVGIDGVDAAGKTTFADALARVVEAAGRPAVRISLDDFYNERSVRHGRGLLSPEAFWLDNYAYGAFREKVLTPLGVGGSGRYCARHHSADAPLPMVWEQAAADAVVLVDGIFLLRDELRAVWDLSVFLQVPFEVSVPRMVARDGMGSEFVAKYVGGQCLYLDACMPWERADVLIDNSDVDAPVLLRLA